MDVRENFKEWCNKVIGGETISPFPQMRWPKGGTGLHGYKDAIADWH